MKRPQTAYELQRRLMTEPEDKRGFFETLNLPMSKLFSRQGPS